MVQVIEKPIKVKNEPSNSLKTDSRSKEIRKYGYLNRRKNPDYEQGIIRRSFESCLNTTKGSKKTEQKHKESREYHIKTRPKWFTDLLEYSVDPDTGEMIPKGVYTSDDFKVSNGKKIKALDRFCSKYQPLYKQRKVTLFFLTFTRADFANLEWKIMIKIIVQYFKRAGLNLRGHIWTSEIGTKTYDKTKNPKDLHWHYHVCICIDRKKFDRIPKLIKFDNIWGQRTEIDFVKKNVRHYLAKYFAKNNARVIGARSYGISRKLL